MHESTAWSRATRLRIRSLPSPATYHLTESVASSQTLVSRRRCRPEPEMSIFNQKSKFKVKTEVRTVRQAVEPKPKPKPQPQPSAALSTHNAKKSNSVSAARSSSGSVGGSTPRASLEPGSAIVALRVSSASSHPERNSRKRRAGSSRSPASPNFTDSGDEEDEDWEESLDARKRRKRADQERLADPNRVLRHPKLWTGSEGDIIRPPLIHAVDVASLEQKCQPVLGLARDQVAVKLQYPGARYPERYVLT